MKTKYILIAALLGCYPFAMQSQSAFDVYSLSQSDLRGSARFMSMAGAFGALGGDLSVLNQNPGGIGIYRSSELGLTLNWDIQNTSMGNGAFGKESIRISISAILVILVHSGPAPALFRM